MSPSPAKKLKPGNIVPILPSPAIHTEVEDAISVGELVEVLLHDGVRVKGALQRFLRNERRISLTVDGGKPQDLPFLNLKLMRLLRPRYWTTVQLPHETDPANTGSGPQRYRLEIKNGEHLEGKTLGYRRDAIGLFLYPVQDNGCYTYLFIPHSTLEQYRFDPCELTPPETPVEAVAGQDDPDIDSSGPKPDVLRGITSIETLEDALKNNKHAAKIKFGEILVKENLITEDQLNQALALQTQYREQGKKAQLGQILVDTGVINMADVLSALSEKLGIPFIDITEFKMNPESIRFVPEDLIRKHNLLPIHHFSNKLVIALENPMDWEALDAVRFHSKMHIEPVMASRESIAQMIGLLYSGPELEESVIDDYIDHDDDDGEVGNARNNEFDETSVQDNVIVKLVNKIIIDAHQQRASDIHIEPYPGKNKTVVRIRKDGSLKAYYEVPSKMRAALVARIKVMADLDISERRKPQDGKIDFKKFGPLKIELRVATIPTANDMEDVVLRLLASGEPVPLDKLGLSKRNAALLRKLVTKPYGLFFVCGPTGSGKTTTLHSVLGHLNTSDRKIWTAEDPVEITQRGLRQVEVKPKIGFNFAAAMRSFLRADPDIIMVGEMRDKETTSMGIEASLTGHLVLSTLHTNTAPETVTRLLDMGMDPFNFADALIGILAQRLAKRLCSACKEAYEPSNEELHELIAEFCFELLPRNASDEDKNKLHEETLQEWRRNFAGEDGKFTLYHPKGCRTCDNTGYSGRLGIHELLPATDSLKKKILEEATVTDLLALGISEGMRTLKQDGLEKVMQGMTDAHTVRTVCIK